MPYSKSLARKTFELNSIQKRRLARQASFKTRKISYDHQQLIFQSTIFQLCAQMEEYLKNIIEDIIYNYKSRGAKLKDLPDQFRTMQLISNQIGSFQSYLNQPDQNKILQKLDINKSIYKVLEKELDISYHIKSTTIIGANKYPSEKNLKRLFQRFGIKDIFKLLYSSYNRDFKLGLKSFLNVRESIAHQAPPNLTYQDVKRNFDNMIELISKIDRVIYKKVVESSSEAYW